MILSDNIMWFLIVELILYYYNVRKVCDFLADYRLDYTVDFRQRERTDLASRGWFKSIFPIWFMGN
jgi:hypothetical protein